MAQPKAEAAAHFANDGASAGAARRFVTGTLASWGQAQMEEVAALLVSELVANVVLHARTDLDVTVRRAGPRVRIGVHDGDTRVPERKFYSLTSATGRGLVLVSEMSKRWGVDAAPDGKTVWFELDQRDVPAIPSPDVSVGDLLDEWDERVP